MTTPSRVVLLLAAVLLALLAWLQYKLWFGSGGAREVQTLSARVDQQTRDNGGLQQRNAEVAAEVEDLKSGEAAVEERARSELGMFVGRGKRVYLVALVVRLGGERAERMLHKYIEPIGWFALVLLAALIGFLVWKARGG